MCIRAVADIRSPCNREIRSGRLADKLRHIRRQLVAFHLGKCSEENTIDLFKGMHHFQLGQKRNHLRNAAGCIFDGFPRTTVQAEEFDKILAGHGLKVDVMIDIHVPEEELVRRILLRGKDSGRADDASEEVIRGRLDVYRQQTAVVSDYYAAQGKYASVNGTGSMEEVFSRITDVIDQLQ